ncbi:hypothetical protein BDW71DRAFT_170588 [Aspergillus fruticulosus]
MFLGTGSLQQLTIQQGAYVIASWIGLLLHFNLSLIQLSKVMFRGLLRPLPVSTNIAPGVPTLDQSTRSPRTPPKENCSLKRCIPRWRSRRSLCPDLPRVCRVLCAASKLNTG